MKMVQIYGKEDKNIESLMGDKYCLFWRLWGTELKKYLLYLDQLWTLYMSNSISYTNFGWRKAVAT